jgi:hypothetical protein
MNDQQAMQAILAFLQAHPATGDFDGIPSHFCWIDANEAEPDDPEWKRDCGFWEIAHGDETYQGETLVILAKKLPK